MKEYYSIPLEDEEAQALLDISRLINEEPVRPLEFSINIDTMREKSDLGVTFWYENHHVIGLFFLCVKLRKLPESIWNLSFLRYLMAEDTPIQTFPPSIKNLENLELLEFINDPETSSNINLDFPDTFQHFKNLKKFHIYGNYTIYIPPSFLKLKKLEELHLEICLFFTNRDYFLKVIKKRIPISHTDFDTKSLNELPKDIGLLKSLKKIILKNLNIENLSITLLNLESLNELDLSDSTSLNKTDRSQSRITNIDIVFKIKSIKSLNLANCKLKAIPKDISNLTKLEIFNISWNHLQEIPIEIIKCQNLEKIYLYGNSFRKSFEKWIN